MIQIKDMEMPKKCQWDCLFCDEDGGACLVADVKTSNTERPKDCPLKEVEEPCESAEMIHEPNALMKFKFSDGTVKYVKTAKIEEQEDCISRVEIEHIFANLNYECAFDMPSFWANKGKDYKVIPTNWHKGYQKALEDIENAVKKLPPVQPKEKVGEWKEEITHITNDWDDFEYDKHTYRCTNCEGITHWIKNKKFCPNCGAKMKGEKE